MNSKLLWPVKHIGLVPGIYISQWFGENPIVTHDTYYGKQLVPAGKSLYQVLGLQGHNGIDIACPVGTPLYAAHDGNVIYFPDTDGYGNYATVTTGSFGTIYGHMSKFEGQARTVKQGDLIGYSGNTGMSSGPHCHFGYWEYATPRTNGFSGYTDQSPLMKIRAFLTGYRKHPEKDFVFRMDSMDRLQWFFEQEPGLADVFQVEDVEFTLPIDRPPFPLP